MQVLQQIPQIFSIQWTVRILLKFPAILRVEARRICSI
jgi:hypothetical protein